MRQRRGRLEGSEGEGHVGGGEGTSLRRRRGEQRRRGEEMGLKVEREGRITLCGFVKGLGAGRGEELLGILGIGHVARGRSRERRLGTGRSLALRGRGAQVLLLVPGGLGAEAHATRRLGAAGLHQHVAAAGWRQELAAGGQAVGGREHPLLPRGKAKDNSSSSSSKC